MPQFKSDGVEDQNASFEQRMSIIIKVIIYLAPQGYRGTLSTCGMLNRLNFKRKNKGNFQRIYKNNKNTGYTRTMGTFILKAKHTSEI